MGVERTCAPPPSPNSQLRHCIPTGSPVNNALESPQVTAPLFPRQEPPYLLSSPFSSTSQKHTFPWHKLSDEFISTLEFFFFFAPALKSLVLSPGE